MTGIRFGALVAGVALLAACNGTTSADPSPAPSPAAAAASPSPSPAPAPSPSPTEVLPANNVDDPVAALEAIVAYRDHLFENPDPDKLSLIYAERCECYEDLQPVLHGIAQDGQRLVTDRPRRFELLEVLDRSGPSADIAYRVDEPAARLLDSAGNELQSRDGSQEMNERRVILVREGGRWLVVAVI